MDLLQRVEVEKPKFADENLIYFSPNDRMFVEMFVESYAESDYQFINSQEVTGTTHLDYGGRSWLHLLHNGKRMQKNLELFEENPAYYAEDKRKQQLMKFIVLELADVRIKYHGGRLSFDPYRQRHIFVEQGNERTCIARFMSYYGGSTYIRGVAVAKYKINARLLAIYKHLENIARIYKLNWSVSVNKELVSRDYDKSDDPSEWMITKNKLSLSLTNNANGFSMPVDYLTLCDINDESQKFFRRFIGKFKKLWSR